MSYEFGRIPLGSGLNIVTGPNGSGKSSILLGISIALGAQYTERSRRLRDLIRWGSKLARVSVLIDNSVRGKGRPYPKVRSDIIRVSRYLRIDGSYWFEVNGVEYSRGEVQELLKAFGFNPDNMFVIMHQNMVEEFVVVSSKDKLKLFEDAVGLTRYRERVVDVKSRLESVLRDEAEVNSLLENAKANLEYWRSEYEKFKVRSELLSRKSSLEVELAWAKVNRKSSSINELKIKIDGLKDRLKNLMDRLSKVDVEIKGLENVMGELDIERRRIVDLLLECSRLIGRLEASGKSSGIIDFDDAMSRFSKLKMDLENNYKRFESLFKSYVDKVSSKAVLEYRVDDLSSEIRGRERELNSMEEELKLLRAEAEKLGLMPSSVRGLDEISSEIIFIDARLDAIGPVSMEAEKMYNNFTSTYNELIERSKVLSENRQLILRELNDRIEVWKKAISNIISDVNNDYRRILSGLDADGYVRIVNLEDIENAGLEILVGFKGSEPILLDGFSQSGGERTTAIISFLLAAQKFIMSPFRAVDEFDVHMDPRNREAIFKGIISTFKDENAQYLAITPSPIILGAENVNVIFIQNVGGKSIVRVVSK